MTFYVNRNDSHNVIHREIECRHIKPTHNVRRVPDDVANRMAETTRDFCDDCVTGSDTELP
jgi:hypothetical protein